MRGAQKRRHLKNALPIGTATKTWNERRLCLLTVWATIGPRLEKENWTTKDKPSKSPQLGFICNIWFVCHILSPSIPWGMHSHVRHKLYVSCVLHIKKHVIFQAFGLITGTNIVNHMGSTITVTYQHKIGVPSISGTQQFWPPIFSRNVFFL